MKNQGKDITLHTAPMNFPKDMLLSVDLQDKLKPDWSPAGIQPDWNKVSLSQEDYIQAELKTNVIQKLKDLLRQHPSTEANFSLTETVEINHIFHKDLGFGFNHENAAGEMQSEQTANQTQYGVYTHLNIKRYINLDFNFTRDHNNAMQFSISKSGESCSVDSSQVFTAFLHPDFPLIHLSGNPEGQDMWVYRVLTFLSAYMNVLRYLNEKGHFEQINGKTLRDQAELAALQDLVFSHNMKYGEEFVAVAEDLKVYLESIPGFLSHDTKKASDQHGFILMQFSRMLNECEFNIQKSNAYILNTVAASVLGHTHKNANQKSALIKMKQSFLVNSLNQEAIDYLDALIDEQYLADIESQLLLLMVRN